MSSLDPSKEKHKSAKSKSAEILGRLGLKDIQLNEYEGSSPIHTLFMHVNSEIRIALYAETIAAEVVHPDDIDVTFAGMIMSDLPLTLYSHIHSL